MISIKYEILFELRLLHEYFTDGKPVEIHIRPSDSTRRRLQDYGLLFRESANGFVVLYEKDTHTAGEPPLKPITAEELFLFEIYCEDPWFVNYTDLPLGHKLPDTLYFNNLTENISSGLKLLNKDNYVGENDVVQLSSSIYNLRKVILSPTALVEITDPDGIAVFSDTLEARDENGSLVLQHQFNFDEFGQGRFDVKVDGSLHAALYVAPELSGKRLAGLLEIHRSAAVPASYAFADGSGNVSHPPVVYQLRFGRRRSTWKYYVILNEFETNPGISIDYQAPGSGEDPYPAAVNFAPGIPEQSLVDTYGSGKVLLFEADTEIPLYETPKKNIRLNKPEDPDDLEEIEDPDNVEILRKHLPNAPVGALKPSTDNSKVYSEIYVFI